MGILPQCGLSFDTIGIMQNGDQDIQVRQMQEGDLDWVIKLGNETPEFKTGTDAAQFYSHESLGRWVDDPNGVTLVVEVGGKLAGFLLGYYMAGPNDGYINCLVVDQEFRRRGLGWLLQDSALTEFEDKGPEGHKCDHVFCVVSEADEPMLSLTRKVGFEVGGKFHYVETMLPRKAKER